MAVYTNICRLCTLGCNLIFLRIIKGDNMENDPPKKKKRYVPANSGKQSTTGKIQHSTFVQTGKVENKALERSRFDYTFQEIINHLLARLLPDSNFTIKLSEKLIFGEQKLLDSLIAKLDNNKNYMTGVTIELREGKTKEDVDYKMIEEFRGKTFNAKLIEMSVRNFFDGTKYQRDYFTFLSQFKDQDKSRVYVRLNKTFLPNFLSAIEEQGSIVQGEERPRRGNRTRFKKTIETIELNVDQIEIGDMKKFFSRSEKIDLQDIEIQSNKNEFGTIVSYKITLKCYEEEIQNKLPAFKYYLRHENFVVIPLKESKHKTELIEEYSQIDEKNITIRFIKGYKSSKWDDKSLLYKIRMDQITKKKTNYTNQYFEAFHLIGVLPTVAEYIDELEHRINQVPMDDIKEQIFVEFDDKIKDYIRSKKKVQTYIQNYILTYMKQFDRICEVQNVKFPLRGIKLNIKLRSNQEQNFKDIANNIAHTMPRNILEQKINVDFMVDEQFLMKLEQANILVVGHQEKQLTYISSTEDIPKVVNTIQKFLEQFTNVGEHSLTVVGLMKKVKYMEKIAKLKESNQDYKDIMVPEPFSEDNMKYNIMFYGPRKKNDAFFEEVKRTIQKMESELGQYCESVDSREAAIIVEDSQFQKEIEKKYKISLMLGQFQEQARIQAGLSEIRIIKDKNFDRVPLGYWIYLGSKVVVSELKQKYLQKFKINVKRFKKEEWLDYQQSTRSYLFVYKQNFQIEDMLTNSLGQNRASQEGPIYIALFMPAVNKNKWMKQLLTSLTEGSTYASLRYNIYIIERDSSQNIAKMVDLPQYTPFNSQVDQYEVEWYCQKKKYNQSANTKINDAVANRLSEVFLQKQDIQTDNYTHICDLNNNTLQFYKHKQGQLLDIIPIRLSNYGIEFDYKGHTFKFPISEYNKVVYNRRMGQKRFFLKIPIYKIDLSKMQQINIFTGYTRPITKQQIKIDSKHEFSGQVKAFYNEQITELVYSFKDEDQKYLNSAATQICNYRKQLWKRQEIEIQEITVQKFRNLLRERIEARAQECGLKYTLDASIKHIVVESLSQKDIEKFRSLIENESMYLQRLSSNTFTKVMKEIKYPAYWQPQNSQIKNFQVNKNTAEFMEVQNLFAIRPIQSLFRIQNKIIYKKYYEQVQHLTYMNGKEPKQMRLFHGTGNTPPEVIWMDNEEGFNINYSSDNNLLGRGIYFAQKSLYSYSYASRETSLGTTVYGMFLCQVLVGDSQYMQMTAHNRNVRGTQPKPNGSGLRYESMKGTHSICDIYVVYKNRRAYPLYFIKFQV